MFAQEEYQAYGIDELLADLDRAIDKVSPDFLDSWLESFQWESKSQNSTSTYMTLYENNTLPGVKLADPLGTNQPCYACFHGDLSLSLLLTLGMDAKQMEVAIHRYGVMTYASRFETKNKNYNLLKRLGIPTYVRMLDFSEDVQKAIQEELDLRDDDNVTPCEWRSWEYWHSSEYLPRPLLVRMMRETLQSNKE